MYMDNDILRKRLLLIFCLCKIGLLIATHLSWDIPTTIKIEIVKQIFWIGLVILGYKISSSLSMNPNLLRLIWAISRDRYSPSTRNKTRMRWLKMVNRDKCFEIKQVEKMFNKKPIIATTNVRTPPIQNSMLCLTKISWSENVGQSIIISCRNESRQLSRGQNEYLHGIV